MRADSGPSITVRSVSFGAHAGARHLNPNFGDSTPLARVSVDVSGGTDPEDAFRRAVARLVRLCPSLARHRCVGATGRSFLQGSNNAQDDLAHLFEHLVIDLGARLSSLDQISGVTCGRRAPANRYDIFVECDRRRSGEFVIRLSAWALGQATQDGARLPSLYGAVRAYALVERTPALLRDVTALGHAARLGYAQAGSVLRLVRRFRPAATIS